MLPAYLGRCTVLMVTEVRRHIHVTLLRIVWVSIGLEANRRDAEIQRRLNAESSN